MKTIIHTALFVATLISGFSAHADKSRKCEIIQKRSTYYISTYYNNAYNDDTRDNNAAENALNACNLEGYQSCELLQPISTKSDGGSSYYSYIYSVATVRGCDPIASVNAD